MAVLNLDVTGHVVKPYGITIGHQTESNAVQVVVNLADWPEGGTTSLVIRRPDGKCYFASGTSCNGNTFIWMPSVVDTHIPGIAYIDIRRVYADGDRKLSAVGHVRILENAGIPDSIPPDVEPENVSALEYWMPNWDDNAHKITWFKSSSTTSPTVVDLDSIFVAEAQRQAAEEQREENASEAVDAMYRMIENVASDVDIFISEYVEEHADELKGAKGDRGEKGEQGLNGNDGLPGAKGEKGDQGERGEKGDRGDTGLQGIKGEKGEKGDTGEKGEQGEKGDPGVKGDTGETGIQGLKGDTGEKGEKGDTGATGIQGEKGEKGDIGATGVQGEKGEKGDPGEKGETGTKGEQGEKGETGATGANGSDGADGYTPVRGTDYWTADDIAYIKAYVDTEILGGAD